MSHSSPNFWCIHFFIFIHIHSWLLVLDSGLQSITAAVGLHLYAVLSWPVGAPLSWLVLWICRHHSLSTHLAFWRKTILQVLLVHQVHLVFSMPNLGVSHFSKELLLLRKEWYLEARRARYHVAVTVPGPPPRSELGNRSTYEACAYDACVHPRGYFRVCACWQSRTHGDSAFLSTRSSLP